MSFTSSIIRSLLLVVVAFASANANNIGGIQQDHQNQETGYKLRKLMMKKSSRKDVMVRKPANRVIRLKVTNLSFQQPFGGVFVMTHNDRAPPLFTLGEEASEPLALLAENGKLYYDVSRSHIY